MTSARSLTRASTRAARATSAALTMVLAATLVGCSLVPGSELGGPSPVIPSVAPPTPEPPAPESALTHSPASSFVPIAQADASAAAVEASATVFTSSPAVVVAPASDIDAQLLGASAAIALGAPLLVTGAEADARATWDEVRRLQPASVITIGAINSAHKEVGLEADVVALNATADHVAAAIASGLGERGRHAGDAVQRLGVADERDAVSAVADLGSGSSSVLFLDQPQPATTEPAPGRIRLPALARPAGQPGVLALATDSPEHLAAVATMRAAGVPVTVLPETEGDPLASAGVMSTIDAAQPEQVVGIGAVFADDAAAEWKVAVAKSCRQLPGGGGSWFPSHTLIGIYGTPGTGSLGILGEQGLKASVTRAKKIASGYEKLTETTVVPTFELIATVAAGHAGADGDYSNEMDIETLHEWAVAADEAGLAVMIDLQPGRSDFLSQAKLYEPLLKLPNVGLALDPEWRLKPKQVHLEQIGQVSAKEVNQVVSYLADLTRDNDLPQKLFVLHQFQLRMIQDRESVDTSRAELAMVIHADGQGGQPDKQATWKALQADAPPNVFWGWKNFIDEDKPMLTPEQTMKVKPAPNLVTYQ